MKDMGTGGGKLSYREGKTDSFVQEEYPHNNQNGNWTLRLPAISPSTHWITIIIQCPHHISYGYGLGLGTFGLGLGTWGWRFSVKDLR